jgi:hypothetical protein
MGRTQRAWKITSVGSGWALAGAGALLVVAGGALPWCRREGGDSWWGGVTGYELSRTGQLLNWFARPTAWAFKSGPGESGFALPTGQTFALAAAVLGVIVVLGAAATRKGWWQVVNALALAAVLPLAAFAIAVVAALDFFLKVASAPGPGLLLVFVGVGLAFWGIGTVFVDIRRPVTA